MYQSSRYMQWWKYKQNKGIEEEEVTGGRFVVLDRAVSIVWYRNFNPTSEQVKEIHQDFTWYKIVSDRENSMYQVPESEAPW